MFRDPQFVITFQLALIGIVLIGGLFLVWKAISRMEEKVDMILMQQDAKALGAFKLQLDNHGVSVQKCDPSTSCCPMESMMANDPVMQKLFQEHQEELEKEARDGEVLPEEFMFFTTLHTPFDVPDGEDHRDDQDPPKVTIEEMAPRSEPEPSEVSEAVGTLSKNKLRMMNLDKLRGICEEKGLSSEGTKNQLIERILQA